MITTSVKLRLLHIFTFVLLFATFGNILFNAWVTEDTFITLRVIDNFFNGYGLRWNIDERVQVYTHPLWMLWLMPWYAAFGEPFYSTIYCSIITSCIALCIGLSIFLRQSRITTTYISCALFLVPLLLTDGFIEFSTSGLENPLSNLLIALFWYYVFYPSKHQVFILPLVASLAILNRMDHALLYAPYLAYHFIKYIPVREWWKGFAAATPLFAWLIFSFVYYGFIFPNTYYAKLNTGIPQSIMWEHGFQYLHDLRYRQPVAALLFFALILLTYNRIFFVRKIKQSALFYAAVACVALFCLYVVYSGGDYMSGRFWVSPLFMSSIIFAWWLPKIHKRYFIIIASCFILLAIGLKAHAEIQYAKSKEEWLYGNIVNERYFYRNTHLLFSNSRHKDFEWVRDAIKRKNEIDAGGEPTQIINVIGMYGYYGGEKIKIIDPFALSEPLLARIPAKHDSRIGHFERIIPAGYFEARRIGDYSQMEPAFKDKALQIKAITQLPIFSKERWQAMRSYYFPNSGN